MILYHGSLEEIKNPDISFSRSNTDFGKGFYTTTIKAQAISWTGRFKRIHGHGTISIYEFAEAELRENISVLEFSTYSIEWLEYITKCRLGESSNFYDLVIGGVANDDVFNTLTLYFRGLIQNEEAIRRLRYEKPNIQYCFKNQKIINQYLRFIGKEQI